jgi:hypothetical protein
MTYPSRQILKSNGCSERQFLIIASSDANILFLTTHCTHSVSKSVLEGTALRSDRRVANEEPQTNYLVDESSPQDHNLASSISST